MRILLVYPYFLEDRLNPEEVGAVPIGLYYVGALLKSHRFDVEIVNWHDRRGKKAYIEQALRDKRPDVIGFSVLHANRWGAIEIAAQAKKLNPDVKVVFGGIGASTLWSHFLKHFPAVDYVVTGEGEYPFLNLVECFRERALEKCESIDGVAFRKAGNPVRNPSGRPVEDLDTLPDPARYFTFSHVVMSRGCPGNCNFCGSPEFWGRKVRFHSAEYFVRQIELLHRKGVTYFFISDDTFTLNKKRVVDVCKRIVQKRLAITWQAIARVNHVDEDMLEWMRLAGCTQISYGVESGSTRIRDFFCKNIHADHIERAFRLTTRYGILARAYYIYGAPGESSQTIEETLALIRKTAPLGAIFYILDIFPGTKLYADYCRKHQATDDMWLDRVEDIMYFETDSQLTRDQILAYGNQLRSTFYHWLPEFVERIQLVDKKSLYPYHADFLSRLAMTFSHGDYAGNSAVRDSDRVSEALYRRALSYHPDYRAFLGLGITLQKSGDYEASIEFLVKGLEFYPANKQLSVCLGISHLNRRNPRKALSFFLKFTDSPEVLPHIIASYEALGDYGAVRHYTAVLKTRTKTP